MVRFRLVRRSRGEGGWLFSTPCHGADIMRDTRGLSFFMSENKKWFAS